MSSDLLIYHHALRRQRVLISFSLFHVIANLLQTDGTRSSMTLVKSLYSVGLHLPVIEWIWWRVLIPTRETLLRRSETIGCENALRTIKSQRLETADTSSSSHCEDSGTCKTIHYTSIGRSTSPAKTCVALGEIIAFWPERTFRHFVWLWFWLLQDAWLEFRNWASRTQHRPWL